MSNVITLIADVFGSVVILEVIECDRNGDCRVRPVGLRIEGRE